MKLLKRLFACLSAILLILPTAFAQIAESDQIVEGEKAKITYLSSIAGLNEIGISRNQQFIFCTLVGTDTSVVIKRSTGERRGFPTSIVEIADWDTYLGGRYAMRKGSLITLGDILDKFSRGAGLEAAPSAANADISKMVIYGYPDAGYNDVIYDLVNGKFLDTLPHFDPGYIGAGLGSHAWGWSDDFTIGAGMSSTQFAFTNRSPVFWDLQSRDVFYVGGAETGQNTDGVFMGCNSDGSILVGELAEKGFYVEYDRNKETSTPKEKYQFHAIANSIGYEMTVASHVSDNGLIIGFDQVSSPDVYSRNPWIYNVKTGDKVFLKEYLSNLYGLDVPETLPLFSNLNISNDGRLIVGFTYDLNARWIAYFIELEETQVHAKARDFVARQTPGTTNVSLRWQEPLRGQYTVEGYNVYRDGQKLNATPLTITSYTDAEAELDQQHTYTVETVYTDGEVSKKYDPISIWVAAESGCLPVTEIVSDIEYNRTVNLYWGLPSAEVPEAAEEEEESESEEKGGETVEAPAAKSAENAENLDLISVFDSKSQWIVAYVQVGDYYYAVGSWSRSVYIYDIYTKKVVAEKQIEGFSGAYDLSYHDNKIYAVNNTNKVTVLSISKTDPTDISLTSTFEVIPTKSTNIAYINKPITVGDDEFPGYLAVGNISDVWYYPLNPIDSKDTLGTERNMDFEGMYISGTEYYDGKFYVADQNNGGQGVHVFDFETGEELGYTDFDKDPRVNKLTDGEALVSGLALCERPDGVVALNLNLQCAYVYGQFLDVEIKSNPKTIGYNVYRNGVKITEMPLKVRHFSEKIYEPGKYTYTIEYLAENDCSKKSEDMGVSKEVQIYAIGTCGKPTALKAREAAKMVQVSWSESELTSNFVGFNIYRNGKLVSDLLTDLKYLDQDVVKGETYEYKVEAFYSNSCIAADSAKVEVTHEGTAQAPSAFRAEVEKNGEDYKVNATWDLPYFEEPLSYGYCNVPYNAIAFENSNQIYAFIGWETNTSETDMFEDLYLVGVEFVVGSQPYTIAGAVIIDDKLVYSETIEENIRVGNEEQGAIWNQYYFAQAFPMKQKQEIAVGYIAAYDNLNTKGFIGIDMGPAATGRGDILSVDGSYWFNLSAEIDANLLINALVVNRRDLESAPSTAGATGRYENIQRLRLHTNEIPAASVYPIENAPKITSESHKLQGFNIYRDGEKLNKEMLTSFKFEDADVKKDEAYDYSVSAVYAGEDEVESDPIYVEIMDPAAIEDLEEVGGVYLYPNPVSDLVKISGEYRSLSIIDLSGRTVKENISSSVLSVADLNPGIYFFNFVKTNGKTVILKVVKK